VALQYAVSRWQALFVDAAVWYISAPRGRWTPAWVSVCASFGPLAG